MILFISIFFLCSGCIYIQNTSDEKYDILYFLEIELIRESQYYVLLPLPITAPDVVNEVSIIINDLKFESGNGNISIENSKYGQVLNVTFSNSIILKAQKNFSRDNFEEFFNYTFVRLSTSSINEKSEVTYFYFHGLENNTISLSFRCYTRRLNDKVTLDQDAWELNLNSVKDEWNYYPINIS
ncbi:MAG: hypothetical protein QCI82_09285 [Candidatus Thermoplasmatota archaeon]|nr:hypothetical protein [Candidatus Thermoplasmatota archaeon]